MLSQPLDTATHYAALATPIGRLLVAYRGATVCRVDLDVDDITFEQECQAYLRQRPRLDPAPPANLAAAIDRYLAGETPFAGELDLSAVSPFQARALRQAMQIERGQIRTYGWIAAAIGAPGAARAVGTAMARNPIPILIPCHRVVRGDGRIGNYGCGGPVKKRALLAHEGVVFSPGALP